MYFKKINFIIHNLFNNDCGFDILCSKFVFSVGEPLNREAFEWYRDVVGGGRCDVIDTWWQTETGGICITPRPSEEGAPILPAMPMRPFYGIAPALVDQKVEI